jgi:CheY-like chemotaxis protein
VLDLSGEATVATASRYFGASGYGVTAAARSRSAAALICVDAERLRTAPLDRRDRKPIVIAVADFGDGSADQLVADGRADAVLTRPLLRADIEDLLGRIVAGSPVLTRTQTAATPGETIRFPGLRVLVADDGAVNREVAMAALARLGVSVETVESGAQAIDAVREGAFDVVLMDGSMPDIDGFAAARAIRDNEAREGRKRLPIVALTAHVIGKAANAWRDAGMDDIIHKPFTLGQLGACLQRLFPDWAGASGPADVDPAATEAATADESDQLLDAGVLHDLEEIAGSTGGDFLQRIFNLFIENAPRIHAELVRAVAEGDREASARAAHALKSMCHNIGARKLAVAAEAIERHARETGVPAVSDLRALSALLDATTTAVSARLESRVQRRALMAERG